MRSPIYAATISQVIIQLNKDFPDTPIGEHIVNALQGAEIYLVTDREFAKLLNEYWATLTLDDYYSKQELDEYNE